MIFILGKSIQDIDTNSRRIHRRPWGPRNHLAPYSSPMLQILVRPVLPFVLHFRTGTLTTSPGRFRPVEVMGFPPDLRNTQCFGIFTDGMHFPGWNCSYPRSIGTRDDIGTVSLYYIGTLKKWNIGTSTIFGNIFIRNYSPNMILVSSQSNADIDTLSGLEVYRAHFGMTDRTHWDITRTIMGLYLVPRCN